MQQPSTEKLISRFTATRNQTVYLSKSLSEADMTIQAADFASPSKWHLAHTTWFFEEFFLRALGHQTSNAEAYRFLFNSYYETIGNRQAQSKRGLITRPTLAEVLTYRNQVDEAVVKVLKERVDTAMLEIIELGIHHEQQHQELFLTDILYTLAQNPLNVAYRTDHVQTLNENNLIENANNMVQFNGGLTLIGHDGNGFGFDNEFPQHKVHIEPFQLASNLITNAEWIAFIEAGGYNTPLLWLADGWKIVQAEQWQMPLYWTNVDDYKSMTLSGLQPVKLSAPVTHISYFEAEAYARWAGKRLPTEMEWEAAANACSMHGNFANSERYQPQPVIDSASNNSLNQMFGEVWQWTASPYIAYPRFKIRAGAVGEYNGKFMNGQYVLRGGSCVSPSDHLRPTYRNFFYPHQRWQFSGLRLAD